MMKRFFAVVLVALLAFTACHKEETFKTATDVTGTWVLSSVTGMSEVPDVVVTFSANGTFEMDQQMMEGRSEHFSGTYELSSGVISGTYDDGSQWADSYKATVKGSQLKLKSVSDPDFVCTYKEKED